MDTLALLPPPSFMMVVHVLNYYLNHNCFVGQSIYFYPNISSELFELVKKLVNLLIFFRIS